MKAGHNIKGFTLLETLLVIFLISLIAGLSTVMFLNSLPSQKLEATAREILATFRYARSAAISEGRWKSVVVDIDSRKFGIEGGKTRDIPEEVSLKVVDNINGEINRGAYRFVFAPSGVAEGGTVKLMAGRRSVLINIDPVVGAVMSSEK